MSEEEKGFVIKDRRALDEKGELKGKEAAEEKPKGAPKQEAKKEEPRTVPLPEVTFGSLIMSLSSSVFLNFGDIADPQTGEKRKDLPLAKHGIDTIAMLKEKTEGNLSEEEQKLVDNILTELRWRYVKAKE